MVQATGNHFLHIVRRGPVNARQLLGADDLSPFVKDKRKKEVLDERYLGKPLNSPTMRLNLSFLTKREKGTMGAISR